uniref:NADH-ubiquinone oxidoreductase chain 5 n=1 Tax=Scaptocoris castanea TaxID=1411909 RepID=A0A343YVR1_9HEMI|nr:NADH dehydrogenase subunit 5 [Scaptocoris castanea]
MDWDFFVFVEWEVFSLNSVSFIMALLLDWMSLIFAGCVLFISSMVILYSSVYMLGDMNSLRFLCLVLLFVASMMFLVFSPNLVSLLLGWDGLGLVSYCLVIYFHNFSSSNAGMLTVLTNRLGDVAILMSIAWLFNLGGWSYIYFSGIYSDVQSVAMLFLVFAAFTKSAQVPFSSWLPAAMAAPTPVSALVHSSTLVTAGVYLLIRFRDFFLFVDMFYPLVLSSITMFMAGLGANFEYDLKSIIALSTLSQLGFMLSVLFMGGWYLSYLHLLTHAFFSALLFLCAGIFIHGAGDSQDIRYMGYMGVFCPYISSCFCISTLSLCGFPFMSGFYSSDYILEFSGVYWANLAFYFIFFLSVGLTVSYSFRLIYYCFGGYSGLFPLSSFEEDSFVMLSMFFLSLMSIFGGGMLSWVILPSPDVYILPLFHKLLPLLFILVGSWLGYELSILVSTGSMFALNFILLMVFFGSMWFLPNFSTVSVSSMSTPYLRSYSGMMDSGWGEYLISGSLSAGFDYFSKYYINYHYNSVGVYLISFLFWASLVIMLL